MQICVSYLSSNKFEINPNNFILKLAYIYFYLFIYISRPSICIPTKCKSILYYSINFKDFMYYLFSFSSTSKTEKKIPVFVLLNPIAIDPNL